jgi:hypothetical protein
MKYFSETSPNISQFIIVAVQTAATVTKYLQKKQFWNVEMNSKSTKNGKKQKASKEKE